MYIILHIGEALKQCVLAFVEKWLIFKASLIEILPPEVLVTLLCDWLPVHTVQGIRVQTRRGGVQLGDEVTPQLQHSETV